MGWREGLRRVTCEVGAPVVLGVIYLTSLVLAIGFHPVNVLKRGWSALKAFFADRQKRRLAAMEETERMEFERRKLSRQAEKLERKLKKKGENGFPALRNRPNRRFPNHALSMPPSHWRSAPRWQSLKADARRRSPSRASADCAGELSLPHRPPGSLDEAGRRPADHDELRAVQGIIIETLAHFGIAPRRVTLPADDNHAL